MSYIEEKFLLWKDIVGYNSSDSWGTCSFQVVSLGEVRKWIKWKIQDVLKCSITDMRM